MIAFLTLLATSWPIATVLIGMIVAVVIIITFLRANRVTDSVQSAVDYERAINARRLNPPPHCGDD